MRFHMYAVFVAYLLRIPCEPDVYPCVIIVKYEIFFIVSRTLKANFGVKIFCENEIQQITHTSTFFHMQSYSNLVPAFNKEAL